MTPLPDPFIDLAIALGLGLLVGLQRESKHIRAAGLRTFALVTLSGTLCALLARHLGGWIVAVGLLAVALLAMVSHYATTLKDGDGGMTTEVALLAMFLIGAGIVLGDRRLAVVLGGTVAVLLQAKAPFRSVMERSATTTCARSSSSRCCRWSSCPCCRTRRSAPGRSSTSSRSGCWWC